MVKCIIPKDASYYKAESIDDVMSHPLFDGKSLTEIFDNISNLEY